MIEILKDPVNYEENMLISNIITAIMNKSKKKLYDKEKIKDFKELLSMATPMEIIEYLFKNNLNLKSVIGTNYRQIQIIYENSDNKISSIEEDAEFELLLKEIKNIQTNRKEQVLNYLSNIYKNTSRSKGNLFKKLFKELEGKEVMNPSLESKITSKDLFNGIKIYYSLKDVLKAKEDENFIYIPETDKKIKEALAHFGIKYKKKKGRDILIRYNNITFLGEAKELHESGGSQDKQFVDMKDCINETDKKQDLIGFGIIYGACLRYENDYQKEIDELKNVVIPSQLAFHLKETLDYLISENK